jgi:hypothetical protein
MTISASDVVFRKSATVTNTTANGGRKGQTQVVTGARHGLFPRVTAVERSAGVTRYRKEFWCNDNADDESAYDVMAFLEFPSNGGDRFYLGKGSQTDTQGDIATHPPLWMGCGSLNSALSGSETEVDLLMESDDFEFEPGGYLHLANKFLTSQTIDTGVVEGDSVTYSGGTWYKIASTSDIEYPNGVYVGGNKVLTEHGSLSEEYLLLAENKTTDEAIGTGDGSSTSPTLTDLAAVTNGVVSQYDYRPVITTTCGSVARTVYIDEDGTCSGYCSAGEINLDTGVWVTDITWTTAPDNTEDILITYYDKNYSYSGNVVTVELDGSVAGSYATSDTYGAGCIYESEVITSSDNWAETSTSGTYDETTYPLVLYNDGTEEDTFTITFTSATAFTCAGLNEGSLGSGSITADFEPVNPNTGEKYFTLDKDGWGGTWAAGETVVFQTHPSAIPIWWKEVVPASTSAEDNNIAILGFYSE